MTIVFGIFLILHALVHLLYAGQVLRFFQLRPGLVWPDGSWLFSRLIGDPPARWLAAVSLTMAALGFLVAALGLFFGGGWVRTVSLATFNTTSTPALPIALLLLILTSTVGWLAVKRR